MTGEAGSADIAPDEPVNIGCEAGVLGAETVVCKRIETCVAAAEAFFCNSLGIQEWWAANRGIHSMMVLICVQKKSVSLPLVELSFTKSHRTEQDQDIYGSKRIREIQQGMEVNVSERKGRKKMISSW